MYHELRKRGTSPFPEIAEGGRPLVALLVAAVQRDGRYWRMIGRSAGIPGTGVIDPIVWSGRAVQGGFVDLLDVRSCINVSGFRLERGELLAIMDISARAISLPDRPRTGRYLAA